MGKKGKSNHSRNASGKNAPGNKGAAAKSGSTSVKKSVADTVKSSDTTAAKATKAAKAITVAKAATKAKAAAVTEEAAAADVIVKEPGKEENIPEPDQVQSASAWLKIKHDGLLPISFVGGLLGMLLGILPATIWMIIFRSVFFPLYMLVPVFIYGGITLFRGFRDIRAVVLTGLLSLAGAYFTAVFCQAAAYVAEYKMSAVNIPLVAADLIGKKEALIDPFFSSENILPLVFTVIGFLIAMLFFKYNDEALTDGPAPGHEHPDKDGHADDLAKAK